MTGERRERERKNQQEPGKQANREQGNQPRPQGSQRQGDQPQQGNQPLGDQPKSQRPASFEEQQQQQGSSGDQGSGDQGSGDQGSGGRARQGEQMREGSQRKQGATTRHTTDHEEIRRWVEERNGHPAAVRETGRSEGDPGIVRIDFPGYSGEQTLEEIDWDEFFSKFDQNELVFLYQEETAAGEKSNFNKIIHRSSLGERGGA